MEKESFASLKKSPPALGGCPAWPRNRSTPSALPVRLTPDASYQTRLWLGVLCGVLLGLSNASFIWATRTIFSRLSPVPPIAALPVVPAPTAKALAVLSITETNLREWERRCSPPPQAGARWFNLLRLILQVVLRPAMRAGFPSPPRVA